MNGSRNANFPATTGVFTTSTPAEHVAVLRERAWQPDLFGPFDEASLYHTEERWGFFSLLLASESGDGRRKSQRTYPLKKLAWVVDRVDPQRDTWISQAEFSRFNRRLVNLLRLGLCFVDLDVYKGRLAGVSQSAQAALLVEYCDGEGIPAPSVIVGSGRGLYAKWLLSPVLSRRALPYWNAVQGALAARLRRFGADFGALDGSRVLRLVGVVNAKCGTVCRVLHVTESGGEPIRYEIDYLGDWVLPVSREELRERRQERAERRERESAGAHGSAALRVVRGTGRNANLRSFSPRQLAWDRLHDLRRLVDVRYGLGPVPEGERMTMLFWQVNFLLLSGATHSLGLWHEAGAVARRLDPDWGYDASELGTVYRKAVQFEAGETVEFAGRQYPALYTPRNDTLIDLFRISDAEQRELATITSRDEVRRRKSLHKRDRRARLREEREEHREVLARRIVELRDADRLSWRQIESQLPVSIGKAFALYGAFKNAALLLGGRGVTPV